MLNAALANYNIWKDRDGKRIWSQGFELDDTTASLTMSATSSIGSDMMSKLSTLSSSAASDATDEPGKGRKKSGRSRQRAAKYWAKVRCRTPSPEPGMRC
jgi:hypothetical protein